MSEEENHEKCVCVWEGSGNYPKQYMKIGLPEGERLWCERCPNVPEDAVYLDNRTCCMIGCSKRGIWSSDGTRNNRVCGLHKIEGKLYTDVVNKKCPCGKTSIYNFPDENQPIACKKCKKEGMVDVSHKRCPCGKTLIYNYVNETRPVACKICKKEGMINVVSSRCSCDNTMNFNYPGEIRAVACSGCKKEGMIDIKHAKCFCGKQACFNHPWEKSGIACADCKKDDMIDVVNKIFPGYSGNECPVRSYLNRGFTLCPACDPDPKRTQHRKKFEDAFFKYAMGKIDINKREFHVRFDQKETSKKCARVDGIVFRENVIVCIEIDENGHNNDSYVCDESRMHLVTGELLHKFPYHDVAWIRVNPTIPNVKNQWSKKTITLREKLFDRTIVEIKTATHGIIYID